MRKLNVRFKSYADAVSLNNAINKQLNYVTNQNNKKSLHTNFVFLKKKCRHGKNLKISSFLNFLIHCLLYAVYKGKKDVQIFISQII